MKIYTTLTKVRENEPCLTGWYILLESLNKTKADDEPIDLLHILKNNGVSDFFWIYKKSNPPKELSVAMAIDFARGVLPFFEEKHPNDIRPRLAIKAAEAWLTNQTDDNAEKARLAADDAWSSGNVWAACAAGASRTRTNADAAGMVESALASAWDFGSLVEDTGVQREKQKQIIIKHLS